jgi:hypothetical protein
MPTDRIGMRKAPCARYAGYWPAVTKMSWTPTYPDTSVRQDKPGAFSGCNSRPGKGKSRLTGNRVLGS